MIHMRNSSLTTCENSSARYSVTKFAKLYDGSTCTFDLWWMIREENTPGLPIARGELLSCLQTHKAAQKTAQTCTVMPRVNCSFEHSTSAQEEIHWCFQAIVLGVFAPLRLFG